MSQQVLIAYASRAGSTAEVAETVGAALRERGIHADVRSVKDVTDITGYDALILGSAIWAGKPLPEMLKFMDARREALARVPVAYFILCEILQNPTPAHRQIALGYLTPMRKIQEPVGAGMFAGRRDLSNLHPLVRWCAMRLFRLADGDWRNWDQIRAWAATVAPRLLPERAAGDQERVAVGAV